MTAILRRKGGAGKTTLALHLAIAAERAGRRAAIFDPQGSATLRSDNRAARGAAVPVAASWAGAGWRCPRPRRPRHGDAGVGRAVGGRRRRRSRDRSLPPAALRSRRREGERRSRPHRRDAGRGGAQRRSAEGTAGRGGAGGSRRARPSGVAPIPRTSAGVRPFAHGGPVDAGIRTGRESGLRGGSPLRGDRRPRLRFGRSGGMSLAAALARAAAGGLAIDVPPDEARLAEIDENLARAELLDRARFVAARKEIHERPGNPARQSEDRGASGQVVHLLQAGGRGVRRGRRTADRPPRTVRRAARNGDPPPNLRTPWTARRGRTGSAARLVEMRPGERRRIAESVRDGGAPPKTLDEALGRAAGTEGRAARRGTPEAGGWRRSAGRGERTRGVPALDRRGPVADRGSARYADRACE